MEPILLIRFTLSFYLVVVLIFFTQKINAQSIDSTGNLANNQFVVSKIIIHGLKRTKPFIVYRELMFKEGDTLTNAENLITKSKNLIFNTRLFNKVDIATAHDTINISVEERWYTYPIPIIDFVDRNFNEWWTVRNRDFRRLTYGIDFTQNNMRGRNEVLELYVQGGFSQKFEAKYVIPYIDKKKQYGMSVFASYIVDKQIGYATQNNYLRFTEIADNARYRSTYTVDFFRRKKLYQTIYFGAGYYSNKIPDTIAYLNPRYFLDGRTRQQFFALSLSFVDDHRDKAFYPLKGYYWSASISKVGITTKEDVNLWLGYIDVGLYKKMSEKWYSSFTFSQKISTPKNQPYIYNRGLGYGSYYVSGYELYVIDGQQFSLAKANLKFRILNVEKTFNFIPIEQFKKIPLQVYLKLYSDGAVAVDQTNIVGNSTLANQFLWGNGIGLDFVTYYDTVFKLEYSINRMMQGGFYLHFKSIF